MTRGASKSPPAAAHPEMEVTLLGERYRLRYSIMALAALQDHWGLEDVTAVGQRLMKMAGRRATPDGPATAASYGAEDLVGLLWAGLRRHHADVPKELVREMLDDTGLIGTMRMLAPMLAGFAASMPAPEPKGKGEDDAARPPEPGR